MDRLISALSRDGFIDIKALSTRDIVQRAHELHGTSPTVTAALGRTLTAASIMGSDLKIDDGSVTLTIKGGGPIGSIIAVSDAFGNVRGCVGDPTVDLPERGDGHLNVGAAVWSGGDGYIQVIKDLGLERPYIGRTPLVSGEIAEDVTSYYFHSEQTPCSCALGVLVGTDCNVVAAGGYIVRLLPGAPDEIYNIVEDAAKNFRPVTEMLSEGMTPDNIALSLIPGVEFDILPDSAREIKYECKCTRERVERALLSMGRAELLKLADEGKAEISCHFCDKVYNFTANELKNLAGESDKQ